MSTNQVSQQDQISQQLNQLTILLVQASELLFKLNAQTIPADTNPLPGTTSNPAISRPPILLGGVTPKTYQPEWDSFTPRMYGNAEVDISIYQYLLAYVCSGPGNQAEYDFIKMSSGWGINSYAGKLGSNKTYKEILTSYLNLHLSNTQQKALKSQYKDKQELFADLDNYHYAVRLDGFTIHDGFGPSDNFRTIAGGLIERGTNENHGNPEGNVPSGPIDGTDDIPIVR